MTEAHKTGDDLRRASRGESRGDPAQSPVPLLVFPRIKLDPYLFTCERTSERRRTDGLASPGAREVEIVARWVRSVQGATEHARVG